MSDIRKNFLALSVVKQQGKLSCEIVESLRISEKVLEENSHQK